MRIIATITRIILTIAGILSIISVLFAVTARDRWWMRAFDYPRLQIAIVSVLTLVLAFFIFSRQRTWSKVF